MTLIEEATELLERMPRKNQQAAVDFLRMMSYSVKPNDNIKPSQPDGKFRRTGKSNFNLPSDFDEHFDDINDEITSLFSCE
ncbi:MAG: hypothetical protein II969_17900 [Anaerolineaceae bacterium]|nr:hypothetical protein [Anaerolineaceae bacterium]